MPRAPERFSSARLTFRRPTPDDTPTAMFPNLDAQKPLPVLHFERRGL